MRKIVRKTAKQKFYKFIRFNSKFTPMASPLKLRKIKVFWRKFRVELCKRVQTFFCWLMHNFTQDNSKFTRNLCMILVIYALFTHMSITRVAVFSVFFCVIWVFVRQSNAKNAFQLDLRGIYAHELRVILCVFCVSCVNKSIFIDWRDFHCFCHVGTGAGHAAGDRASFSALVSFVSDELLMSSDDSFARLVCALVTKKEGSRWWHSAECAQHLQVDKYSQQ